MIAFSLVRQVPNIRLVTGLLKICGDVGVAEYAVPAPAIFLGENNCPPVFQEATTPC